MERAMNRELRATILRFLVGAFGTFLMVALRGLPLVPMSGNHYFGIILGASGGIVSTIWMDDNLFRTIYFELTWPLMLSALTK
jgi:hypothetical protein